MYNYLKQKINQKKHRDMKTITITIPARSYWSILISLAIMAFAYIQAIGYIIPGFEHIIRLKAETATINHVGLIWLPIITYLIIGTFICMVIRIFKELKPYKEKGLIWCLILSMLSGLAAGLMLSIIGNYSIGDTMWGFVGCLGVALMWGLISGFLFEFKSGGS